MQTRHSSLFAPELSLAFRCFGCFGDSGVSVTVHSILKGYKATLPVFPSPSHLNHLLWPPLRLVSQVAARALFQFSDQLCPAARQAHHGVAAQEQQGVLAGGFGQPTPPVGKIMAPGNPGLEQRVPDQAMMNKRAPTGLHST
jgi:hypothetical protein